MKAEASFPIYRQNWLVNRLVAAVLQEDEAVNVQFQFKTNFHHRPIYIRPRKTNLLVQSNDCQEVRKIFFVLNLQNFFLVVGKNITIYYYMCINIVGGGYREH